MSDFNYEPHTGGRRAEAEAGRILKVKSEHDQLRHHRKEVNAALAGGPLRISRHTWKNLLIIHRNSYGQNPIVVNMADFDKDERLLLFPPDAHAHRYIPADAMPEFLSKSWRVSLKDEWVMPSHDQRARAIVWSLTLRAESKAKNNLMVNMYENAMMVAGKGSAFRDDDRHLRPFMTDGFLFGELDTKPWDCWALHLKHSPHYEDGEWHYNRGLLIVRRPEMIDVEKCERDYAMAMLAGLKPTDLQRRLNNA